MRERLSLWLRSVLYALRGGFLIRPFLIALFFGTAGAVLSFAEEYAHELNAWVPEVLFPAHQDPQVALAILSGIAGSIMTVVSIVFAILLMTLTLASTQFSPRILVSFVRDRATQWTLGIFLGTFSYCMAALPAVRSLPQPFVPVLTVLIAMLLALLCVGWLIFFINHIARSISVNHIVDRIAGEAELVIDELMPHPRGSYEGSRAGGGFPRGAERVIVGRKSGYIRFVDVAFLFDCAKSFGVQITLDRRVGHFVPAGVPLDSGRRCGPGDAGARGSAADRDRHRSYAHDAAGRRIRHHPDRRYRAQGDLARGQRSDHGDQLHRSARRVMIVWTSRAAPPSRLRAALRFARRDALG